MKRLTAIQMARAVKQALRARRRVTCDFEEPWVDTLPNQILRSTLDRIEQLNRAYLHFTPASKSWINLVERVYSTLTQN